MSRNIQQFIVSLYLGLLTASYDLCKDFKIKIFCRWRPYFCSIIEERQMRIKIRLLTLEKAFYGIKVEENAIEWNLSKNNDISSDLRQNPIKRGEPLYYLR